MNGTPWQTSKLLFTNPQEGLTFSRGRGIPIILKQENLKRADQDGGTHAKRTSDRCLQPNENGPGKVQNHRHHSKIPNGCEEHQMLQPGSSLPSTTNDHSHSKPDENIHYFDTDCKHHLNFISSLHPRMPRTKWMNYSHWRRHHRSRRGYEGD